MGQAAGEAAHAATYIMLMPGDSQQKRKHYTPFDIVHRNVKKRPRMRNIGYPCRGQPGAIDMYMTWLS